MEILVHENGPIRRLLTRPTLARTLSKKRVERSIWKWRPCEDGVGYRLTPLGVLNKLGVYLHIVAWPEDTPVGECKYR